MRPASRPAPLLAALAAAAIGLLAAATAGAGEPRRSLHGDFGPVPEDLLDLTRAPVSDAEARALFDRVRRMVLERHTDRAVSEADLYLAATAGMLELLNRRAPHRAGDPRGVLEDNALLTGEALRSVEEVTRGEKTGVGVEFQPSSPRGGVLLVQRVFEGSAAARRGLQRGDRILAIDGHPLGESPIQDTLAMLRGRSGTPIHLQVQRPGRGGGTFAITLTRGTYRVASVTLSYPAPHAAHVQVSHFHGRTAAELREALAAVEARGVRHLVLDLRNNPGGLIDEAAAVAAQFLPDGELLGRVEDTAGAGRDLIARGGPRFRGRLLCLVNRYTTAAAELVASALQDNGRAGLVGEPTMGKATTDSITFLRPDLGVRLTTSRYVRIDGGSWERSGLEPDFPVAATPSPAGWGDPEDDLVLGTALTVIASDESEPWVSPALPPDRSVRPARVDGPARQP